MQIKDIPKMRDNELIRNYVSQYSSLIQSWTLRRGIKQLEKQVKALENELQKRDILTAQDIEILNR